MPQVILSDEYYDDLLNTFGMYENEEFVDRILEEAKADPDSPIWGYIREGEYGDLVDYVNDLGVDVPEDVGKLYLNENNEDIDEDIYIAEEPHSGDRSFRTGAEFAGSWQIKEVETENIYIPSSYYCHTKVFNKFLELQTRGSDNIPLEGKGVNPYAMSKIEFLNHVVKYMFKCQCKDVNGEKRCDTTCVTEKRKKYEDKKTGNDFYKTESVTSPSVDKPENYMKPSICNVWYENDKVQIKTLNKAKQSHPYMCIGLIALKDTKLCHAVLIKNYHKVTLEDITFQLTKTKELYPGFKKFKQYMYKNPKPHACSWDIETHVVLDKDKKGKYSYKLITAGIGYEIINIVERTIIQPYKRIYNSDLDEKDVSSLFDEFFISLKNDCDKYSIKEINMYAYNSGNFDSQFAKKSKVIKFGKEISTGNKIKSLKATIDGLTLNLLDLCPFTLQSLKDACETFKTEICKEEFDIINKSRMWYYLNSDESIYNSLINDETYVNKYLANHLDMYARVNHNTRVYLKDNKITMKSKDKIVIEDIRNEKNTEMNKIKSGYKDWSKYLSFDVRSLSNLIFNVENLYNDIGFSITNYVGLPGVSMDAQNSYCYNLSKLYVPSDPSMVELCHASIHGGKVIHFHKNWDSPVDENGNYTDYLISLDMNSEYPSMMWAAAFPLGKPELVTDLENFNDKVHYIGEFEIQIPNIRYAIHPYKSEKGALLYPSNQTIIGVYNDVDIRDMMKDGYKVKMLKGIYWKKSGKIFSNLIEMLFNKRAYFKSLNPDDPDYTKEYLLKILLNAMFGKFNETIRAIIKYFSGEEEDLINIIKRKARYTKMENGQFRIAETLQTPRISKPTYIAGYITAYSRTLLNEVIRKVGSHNVYYSDTDSVYIKYSDYAKSDLKCSNGLAGFKNDYGDGVMITKARFLDIKRCYFEFRTLVKSKFNDKWGKPHATCKDPITKKVNEGEPYYVKTFKFKYTGINFKDIVISSTLEPDNKLFSNIRSYEDYNKVMNNTSKIVDKFIENNKKNKDKSHKRDIENIKFMMRRFKKDGHKVTINLSEFAFNVTPEKRGQWIQKDSSGCGFTQDEYYALGFDMSKKEEFNCTTGNIGDIVNKFSKCLKVNYGLMLSKEKSILRSKRPLFYNIRMHIEIIKERANLSKKVLNGSNQFVKEYNEATIKSEYIQKIFNEYLELDKSNYDECKKYNAFLQGLEKIFITNYCKQKDEIRRIDMLVDNDVIYDKTKVFDTDYYIEFFEDNKDPVKYADNNKKYRILSKLIKYKKEEKIEEFFIPNYINVKGRAENINKDNLYPVIMLSTRFNEVLGYNNMENWQALVLSKLVK